MAVGSVLREVKLILGSGMGRNGAPGDPPRYDLCHSKNQEHNFLFVVSDFLSPPGGHCPI